VYLPAEEIASDPMAARLLLRDMERDWRQLKARYEEFEQFWALVREDAQLGETA